jgi:hypothetical protein
MRHQEALEQLEALGFRPLCTYSELVFPFSLLALTPVYWMMRMNREVVRTEGSLQIATYYPLLINHEAGAIALTNSLGVKFYSAFADGGVVITGNSGGKPLDDPRTGLYKQNLAGDPQEVWGGHLEGVAQRVAQGAQMRRLESFQDYVAISKREERQGALELVGVIGVWLLVTLGPLAAGLYYLARLVHTLLTSPGVGKEALSDVSRWLAALGMLLVMLVVAMGVGWWLDRRRARTPQERSASTVASVLVGGLAFVLGLIFMLVMWFILRGVGGR